MGYLCSLYRLQNILIGSQKVKEFIEQLPDMIRVCFDAIIGSTSVHSGENIASQAQVECRNIPHRIDMQQIEQGKINEVNLNGLLSSLEVNMRTRELFIKGKINEVNLDGSVKEQLVDVKNLA